MIPFSSLESFTRESIRNRSFSDCLYSASTFAFADAGRVSSIKSSLYNSRFAIGVFRLVGNVRNQGFDFVFFLRYISRRCFCGRKIVCKLCFQSRLPAFIKNWFQKRSRSWQRPAFFRFLPSFFWPFSAPITQQLPPPENTAV